MLPRVRPLHLLSVCVLLAAAAAAQGSEGSPDATPKARVRGVDVTFLANAGFFLESGRYSVLIDAFVREPTEPYGALPAEVHKQLANAHAPFDGLTIVLVSHDHPDHVQMRGLEKYLGHNNRAQLMSSVPVLSALRESAREFETIQRRLTPIRTVRGTMTQLVQEEMALEVFELPHAGKANADVHNLAHLIEMGGLRLLHLGDAEPAIENFAPHALAARKIDVAFVPYWFVGKPGGVQILQEEIRARHVVLCHVPPREWDELSEVVRVHFPDFILFREALEKRRFEPVQAEQGAGN